MQCAVQLEDRLVGAATGMRRIAILASVGGLAVLALALPLSLEGAGHHLSMATAAAAEDAAGGNGSAASHPKSGSLMNNTDADSADEKPAAAVPVAGEQPATTNVIRELSGLSDDAELSDEEEREAIRSGWGTWRTADGPETQLSQ